MASGSLFVLALASGVTTVIACSSSSRPPSGGTGCSGLSVCCSSASFPASQYAGCESLVAAGVDSQCSGNLTAFEDMGYCSGSPGSGTGSGTGTGSGSGSGGGGDSCNVPADGICYTFTNASSGVSSLVQTQCSGLSGTILASCPTANVVGCCTAPMTGYTREDCYYSGTQMITAMQVMQLCVGGTFSMTP